MMLRPALRWLATLTTVFACWLPAPSVRAGRRLDRRIGLLVPNAAAAQSQGPSASAPTTTMTTGNFGAGNPVDHRGGQRLNDDELGKLGVDADEVSRHVRRLEEDDTNRQQQQQRLRHTSAAGLQQLYARTMSKNPAQIRSEHHLMRRYYIRNNRTAACNDGSRAGSVHYYITRFIRRQGVTLEVFFHLLCF